MSFRHRCSLFCLLLPILVVSLTSCKNRLGDPVTPLWTSDQLEAVKLLKTNPDARIRETSVTGYQKPPFYSGPMPFTYTSDSFDMLPPDVAMGVGGIVLKDDFTTFENFYVYPDDLAEKLTGPPVGAVTMSPSGEVLAEAKVISRSDSGLDVEERQYSKCDSADRCYLAFKSLTHIGESGYKEKETQTSGHKQAEYYFIWPMGH